MDIKINNIQQMTQTQAPEQVQEANGDFKFVLTSKLEDASLAERLNLMLQDITQQGERISKKNDIKDMQRYRLLIKDFLNEVVTRSHFFSRENFLNRKARRFWQKSDRFRGCFLTYLHNKMLPADGSISQ